MVRARWNHSMSSSLALDVLDVTLAPEVDVEGSRLVWLWVWVWLVLGLALALPELVALSLSLSRLPCFTNVLALSRSLFALSFLRLPADIGLVGAGGGVVDIGFRFASLLSTADAPTRGHSGALASATAMETSIRLWK